MISIKKRYNFYLILIFTYLLQFSIVCSWAYSLSSPEWQRSWESEHSEDAESITIDQDNKIYVVGQSMCSHSNVIADDMVLVKFNEKGDNMWSETWGDKGIDKGLGVSNDLENNIYVVGAVDQDKEGGDNIFLLKYSDSGDLEWDVVWSGGGADEGKDIVVDSFGNIYVLGTTTSIGAGQSDILLMKFNPSGELLWNITWGGTSHDYAGKIALDSFGNIFFTGRTNNLYSHKGFIVIKCNKDGDQLWTYILCTNNYYNDYNSIIVDSKNNILFTANDKLIKFNQNGSILWKKELIGFAQDIAIDSEDNIHITGGRQKIKWPRSGFFYEKLSPSRELKKYSIDSNLDTGLGIAIDSKDNVYIVGTYNDFVLIKNPSQFVDIEIYLFTNFIILICISIGMIILEISSRSQPKSKKSRMLESKSCHFYGEVNKNKVNFNFNCGIKI